MRVMPLDRVHAGMILGRNVYVGGRLLLREGVTLGPNFLDRLRMLGIRTVYIKDPVGLPADPEEIHELLSEETRIQASETVRRYMEQITKGIAADIGVVSSVVNDILDEVLTNRSVLIQLTEIRAMNDYVFAHSVGVSTTATLLGIHAGLNHLDLKKMATGAILHDVGKVRIPDAVWNKPGKLTDEERRTVQQHPAHGYEVIRQHSELSIVSAHVAYQHHERYDGSGYPRGLSGEGIHPFARLVAVADVFDALTTDRPYRAAWPIPRAITFIQEQAGRTLDPRLTRTFLARVAPYPVGSPVRLNTGEPVVVIRLNEEMPARPLVRSLENPEVEYDLSVDLARRIVSLLDERPYPSAGDGAKSHI